MAAAGVFSLFVFASLACWACKAAAGVEKIKIDAATRLYRGASDGRVYMFHGLDTEDSSRPWYLRTLNQAQIDLMKSVRPCNSR